MLADEVLQGIKADDIDACLLASLWILEAGYSDQLPNLIAQLLSCKQIGESFDRLVPHPTRHQASSLSSEVLVCCRLRLE